MLYSLCSGDDVHSRERRCGFLVECWVGLQNFDLRLPSQQKLSDLPILQAVIAGKLKARCTFGGSRSSMTGTRQSQYVSVFRPSARVASRECFNLHRRGKLPDLDGWHRAGPDEEVRPYERTLPCVSG